MCDIFSDKLHQIFVDQVDRKIQGFKYFGRNFDVLRSWLLVVTKVTAVSESLKLVLCFIAK